MALLDDGEIESRLADLPGWSRRGEAIEREFGLEGFVGSVRFVDAMVAPAERMGHHPDVAISWDKVTVTITTHSEGGLTGSDFELAAEIDRIPR